MVEGVFLTATALGLCKAWVLDLRLQPGKDESIQCLQTYQHDEGRLMCFPGPGGPIIVLCFWYNLPVL